VPCVSSSFRRSQSDAPDQTKTDPPDLLSDELLFSWYPEKTDLWVDQVCRQTVYHDVTLLARDQRNNESLPAHPFMHPDAVTRLSHYRQGIQRKNLFDARQYTIPKIRNFGPRSEVGRIFR
jgi:hypothetical protein